MRSGAKQMGFTDPNFWQNFWPNFWADLIVGIVIAGILSILLKWVLAKTRKVEARILTDMWLLSETECRLAFRLRNTGKVAFKRDEIYWHISVEDGLQPEVEDPGRFPPTLPPPRIVIQGNPFLVFRGSLGQPLFPERQVDLLVIKVRTAQIEQVRLYYFLSTAYSLFPKHVRIDSDEHVLPGTLGIVETRLKQTAT